nr:lipoprotein [Massilia eburnea]
MLAQAVQRRLDCIQGRFSQVQKFRFGHATLQDSYQAPILIVKSRIALAVLATTVLLAGCGQTGPLYLPKPPAKPATAGKPGVAPPEAPVPSTPPASQQ